MHIPFQTKIPHYTILELIALSGLYFVVEKFLEQEHLTITQQMQQHLMLGKYISYCFLLGCSCYIISQLLQQSVLSFVAQCILALGFLGSLGYITQQPEVSGLLATFRIQLKQQFTSLRQHQGNT